MIPAFSAHWHFLWLVIASLLAGIVNAMAAGGSFFSFPALLGMGVHPVEANVTDTVALWPGQLTSLATLHGDVRRSLLPAVLVSSVLGGTIGAEVLLHTQQKTFVHLIPWLLLLGAVLFSISEPISNWVRERATYPHHAGERPITIPTLPLALALFPICLYIGYFGVGGGFLIMTILSLFGVEGIHQLNAMKVVTSSAANFFAILAFVVSGRIVWQDCLVSMLFAATGGYLGARNARRMDPATLRAVMITTGFVISGYFFWRMR